MAPGRLGGFRGALDGLDELEEPFGVAVEDAVLLLFEQPQQAAVFLHFTTQTFG